ncbi:MAG: type II secretion system F family protein [Sphingomonadaceae bacterium]
MPLFTFALLMGAIVMLIFFALATPANEKAQSRRLDALRMRHGGGGAPTAVEAQMRRVLAARETKLDTWFMQFVPKPELLRKRIAMTGKDWTLTHYAVAAIVITILVAGLAWFKGMPIVLALLLAMFVGIGLPHMVIGTLVKRRVNSFTVKFPDAIDLLVRGLRSGLPISETISVVASEVPGPVGFEFRSISDKMKIGKTMDQALQETAERLGTPEFQFFCITLAIQRETGGNLAETLSNLGEVLRKRMQMKLKIKAMSSESKASAYIIGVLPFIVFGLILTINPPYMMSFFTDERLMVAGGVGIIWMAIGAFIMKQMINFEI